MRVAVICLGKTRRSIFSKFPFQFLHSENSTLTCKESVEDFIRINRFSGRTAQLHQSSDSVLVRNGEQLSILGRWLEHPSIQKL